MKNRTGIKILIVSFFSLALFVFGHQAKAACVWQNVCNSTYYLETMSGSCDASGPAPNSSSKCCCDGNNVTNALTSVANIGNCSWQFDLLGKPCGSLANASAQTDSFCTNQQKIGNDAKCCCLPLIPTVAEKPAAVLNNPFDSLNVQIPGLYEALKCKKNSDGSYTCPKVNCEKGANDVTTCEVPWIGQYLIAIYNYALVVISILAAVTVMAGGIIWLISGSNASRMKVAKDMITGSFSGLAILFASYTIISIVNPDLIIFKSIQLGYVEEIAPDYSDVTVSSSGPSPFVDACKVYKNTGDDTACKNLKNAQLSNMTTIQGKMLAKDFAEKVEKALTCVNDKNKGKPTLFSISSGARTVDSSIRLWNAYLKNKKIPAAPPCCSNHMSGYAVDIRRNDLNWFNDRTKNFIDKQFEYIKTTGLESCMNQNGLYAGRTIGEPWHFSLTGK